jgi:hypothetical protein
MVNTQITTLTQEIKNYQTAINEDGLVMFNRLKLRSRACSNDNFVALQRLGLDHKASDEDILDALKTVLDQLCITPYFKQIQQRTSDIYRLYPEYFNVSQVVLAGNQDAFLHEPKSDFGSHVSDLYFSKSIKGKSFVASDIQEHTSVSNMNYPIIKCDTSLIVIAKMIVVKDGLSDLISTPIKVSFDSIERLPVSQSINTHPFNERIKGECTISDPNDADFVSIKANFEYSLELQDLSKYPIQDWSMDWLLQFVVK